MKRNLLLCLSLVLMHPLLAQSKDAYSIEVTVKPLRNVYLFLGYHYGPKKGLVDSVLLDDNSKAVFKGSEPLPGGIYFIVSPRKEIMFEMLIDKEQHFTVSADTLSLPDGVVFTGSEDNNHFQRYTLFANLMGEQIMEGNSDISEAKTPEEAAASKKRLKLLTDRLEHYRDSIVTNFPASILTALFNAMKDPVIPPPSQHPGGKYDTLFAYRYYKGHYWDGIRLDDERLVRTPFFESKLERYFKDLVAPVSDSIIKEVDHMLLYSRTSKDMYQYLMVYFVQRYINPEYMGQDAVFVHLFEKYINTGQADFFTQEYNEYMTKRAYSLMANLIGLPAANLDMVDTTGKPTPLYGVKSNLTLVCFWDPTCGHCKETVPRIDSIYKAKWKNMNVAIYAVMTDGGKDNWQKFIREHDLKGWIHVYQLPSKAKQDADAQRPSYKQLYDVYSTPLLYLLDKDKKIIAKKLGFEQMDEIITLKSKK